MTETTATNAFNPDKKTFKLMGAEFEYQFIPSVHFQYVLSLAVKLSLGIVRVGDESQANAGSDIGQILSEALEGRQYEILRDVLKYQNGKDVSLETLKYKTRPTEIAHFMLLMLNDQEVLEASEVMTKGMGESVGKILNLFQMPNSTPSS